MSSKKSINVKNTDELRTAMEAGYTKDEIQIVAEDVTAQVTAARTEGHEAGLKAGRGETADVAVKAAVTAERERIAKIQGMARDGFATELKAAIDKGDSPEAFAMTLITVASDRGITLDAIKKNSPKPAPHANPGEGDAKAKPSVSSTAIYASRRAKAGHVSA